MNYPNRSQKARIVRHKGHTFKSTGSDRSVSEVNLHVFFTCMVCGCLATAEQHGNFWRDWKGAGTKVSCGEVVASEVMDS